MKTGTCISVHHSTINGMELGVQGWSDVLLLKYRVEPPGLHLIFNDCGGVFSIYCAVDCNKGFLITTCHKKLCNEVTNLSSTMYSLKDHPDDHFRGSFPSLNNPHFIKYYHVENVGLFIRDLWYKVMYSIHDMQVVNIDASS